MWAAGVFGVCLLALPLANASAATNSPLPAPRFDLPAVRGHTSLDSLRGRVVLVDFWASWCEPCKRSFPWLNEMQRKYATKGFRVVAINLDKDRDLAEAFLDKYPASFTIAFDPDGKTAESYRVQAMPTSVLVSRDGNILIAHAGFDPRQTGAMESRIEEACTP